MRTHQTALLQKWKVVTSTVLFVQFWSIFNATWVFPFSVAVYGTTFSHCSTMTCYNSEMLVPHQCLSINHLIMSYIIIFLSQAFTFDTLLHLTDNTSVLFLKQDFEWRTLTSNRVFTFLYKYFYLSKGRKYFFHHWKNHRCKSENESVSGPHL